MEKSKKLNDNDLNNVTGGTMSPSGIDDETTKYKLGNVFMKQVGYEYYNYEITDIFKKYGRIYYHLNPLDGGSSSDISESELEKYYELQIYR